jgi:ubiquinone/menaquinone biosynthesis C-methylase UbiE
MAGGAAERNTTMESSPSVSAPASGSAAYFNQAVDVYDSAYDANTPGGYALRVRQQRVLDLLDGPGGKALDVGCGAGRMASALTDRGYDFWGVDAAPAMIELARRRHSANPRAHFHVADAHALAFEDGSFDVVICMGVIDRIQDWESAILEMIRVLRPGGALIISFANLLSPYAWWKNFVFYPTMAFLRPFYYRLRGQPAPVSLYNRVDPRGHLSLLASLARLQTDKAVLEFLHRLNLHGTDVVYYNFNLFLSPLDEWMPRWSVALSQRIERLRFGPLRWLGAGYVVKAVSARDSENAKL